MAATTLAVIGAAAAAKGTIDANKNAKAGIAASNAAANRPAPTVDINALDAQARAFAQRNAADSAALEAQYNPGAAQLRSGSIEAILAGLQPNGQVDDLSVRISEQAGQPLSRISAPGAEQYDSALTRQAVEQAAADLALGGELPQDVRNLVARNAFARSGSVTGNLNLGRDLTTRDLGLTSLDLRNKRLSNAAALGAQEAALGQGNAALRQAANALGVNVAGLNMQGEQYGRQNLFDSASFLNNLNSGDFARALAAGQLGQNIAAPMSGLDPGSVVNLAVGNTNLTAAQQQQADALKVGAANQKAQLGAQLAGTGLGFVSNYLNTPRTAAPVAPTYNYVQPAASPAPGAGYNTGFSYGAGTPAFNSYFGTS